MTGMAACKSLPKETNSSASELVEKYWKLTALSGQPVDATEGSKEAHIIFKQEGGRVNGNSGCNTFSGTYKLQKGGKISFSQMVTTMMMCINMDIETKFLKVLENADNYTVNGNTLVLYNARKEPLAGFEVVYLR
jgi:heat shock protein HslJ